MTVGTEAGRGNPLDSSQRTAKDISMHDDNRTVPNGGEAPSVSPRHGYTRPPGMSRDGGHTSPGDPPTDSSSLSLVSSVATSEEDISSREDSDCSGSGPKKKHKVRFAHTSVTSWASTLQGGFLYNLDPFSAARRQCPRHILSAIDRNCKVPDTDLDEFGQVSKRALPEHYYANTGTIGRSTRPRGPTGERSRSPGRPRRDRNSADDFTHPRCFANPKNNIRLTTIYDLQTAGYLDTSLVSPNATLQASTSKMIRFAESGQEADSPHRLTDSPGNSSQRTAAKSPSDSEGFFYGQRRPGVKVHSCLTDA